ncbi:4-hydroxybenzoate polyprenyltransferase, mitochondrial [Colletotrichum tanaceti]|uniref:4-hydroxybenzoate polyprenyltransferase, mitochondrial n=1 Tax=Colletotrichum tanaceti TaxID=1306861 RepID=A0A4U6XNY1_9PEZI|nr:4-hydroxybenzoate polyprenyltransferase, mitochondrial [Colletotrichum tanaceti]TKW57441.1 4-hydroxybenzoate polyprenyltransferase, mitochondrial [Colletotrichum tanaceti]
MKPTSSKVTTAAKKCLEKKLLIGEAAAPPHPYKPPTKGILSMLPASWVPYAELARAHQPHGIYMIYFPQLLGLVYAASVLQQHKADSESDGLGHRRAIRNPPRPSELAYCAAAMLGWTVFWRSGLCAWNDNVDQDFDRKTARCRNRPIARGAVSTARAHLFSLVLVLAAFACLRLPLPPLLLPPECAQVALGSTALGMIYPFGKRFTHYPQLILGSTLGSTVVLSAYAVGLPALAPPHRAATACLAAAVLLLVVFYDTVYARQDTADDLKSGVKGMAVRFRDHIEGLLAVLALSIAALLTAAGLLVGAHQSYYLFSVAGLTVGLVSLVALTHWDLLPSWAGSSGWCYALAIANLIGGMASQYYHLLKGSA